MNLKEKIKSLRTKMALATAIILTPINSPALANTPTEKTNSDDKTNDNKRTEVIINSKTPNKINFSQDCGLTDNIRLDSYNWLVNDITQIGIDIASVDIDVGTVKFSPEDFKGLENEIMKKLIKNIKNSPTPRGKCTASVKKGINKTSELKTKMDRVAFNQVVTGEDLARLVKNGGIPGLVVFEMQNPNDIPYTNVVRCLPKDKGNKWGHCGGIETIEESNNKIKQLEHYGVSSKTLVSAKNYLQGNKVPPQFIATTDILIGGMENYAQRNNQELITIYDAKNKILHFYTSENIPENLKQDISIALNYEKNKTILLSQINTTKITAEEQANKLAMLQQKLSKNDIEKTEIATTQKNNNKEQNKLPKPKEKTSRKLSLEGLIERRSRT